MQPNEQTVIAMRDASRANTVTQGTKPQGPLGVLTFRDDNVEKQNQSQRDSANSASTNQGSYAAGGAAAQPGQPGQPKQGGDTVARTGIGQGQTVAAGGLISGAMSRRI
jgi:hypothetical protein